MQKVQGSGVCNVQVLGIWFMQCTEFKYQAYIMYRVHGSGVGYIQSAEVKNMLCKRVCE